MLIDWRKDDGGLFRIVDGSSVTIAKSVEVNTNSRLITIEGHGWLEVHGSVVVEGDTARVI